MRSLTLRFTLAFLLVGVIVVAFVGTQVLGLVRGEFSQFLLNRDQQVLLSTLETFYAEQTSWDGVNQFLLSNNFFETHSHDVALLDTEGNVIFGDQEELAEEELDTSIPINVNGQTVGALLVESEGITSYENLTAETQFLQSLTSSTGKILAIAILFSFMVGSILARSMSRPIRELTHASQQIAEGEFGQQVKVRSRDEIGRLGHSFNQMSAFLKDSRQQRKQMTADIAHELRTPLAILAAYTEGLKDGTLEPNSENFEVLDSEVQSLSHLVEDLRTLSLSDAGELKLHRQLTDIAPIIEKVVLIHSNEARMDNLDLAVDLEKDLPKIEIDGDRISQVLKNLISNAIRYSSEGQILVSASKKESAIEVSVADQGSGISPQDLPHLFDRFFMVDESRSRSDGASSGLGLAIVKAIVEAHDGSVSVASELGRGSIFTLRLPI